MNESPHRFRLAGVTHIGRRASNQDSLCLGTLPSSDGSVAFAAVADGVGGQPEGAQASAVAVSAFERRISTLDVGKPETFERGFVAAVSEANRAVLELAEGREDGAKPSTTFVCALAWNGQALVANLGDSRLYVVADGAIRMVSRDHTRVAEAIRSGLPAEKILGLRDALNRFLGRGPQASGDLTKLALPGDAILFLCTDGMTGSLRSPLLTEEEILRELTERRKVDWACKNLLRLAHERGSRDNITAVAVEKGVVRRRGSAAPLLPPLPGEDVLLA